MLPHIKIRGIYSTAMTKLAIDSGFQIAEPSEKVRERQLGHLRGRRRGRIGYTAAHPIDKSVRWLQASHTSANPVQR